MRRRRKDKAIFICGDNASIPPKQASELCLTAVHSIQMIDYCTIVGGHLKPDLWIVSG